MNTSRYFSGLYVLCVLSLLGCGTTDSEEHGPADATAAMDAEAVDATGAVDGGLPPDAITRVDAHVLRDMGPVDRDSGPQPDVGPRQDAGTMDAAAPTPAWTWADCRVAHTEGDLSPDDRALCDTRYRTPAETTQYGLHWIFLGHSQEVVDTYPATQLGDVNTIYGPNDISFTTASRVRIIDPVVIEGGRGMTQYTVRDVIPDLRQHLGVETDDPQEVLDVFIQRQEDVGVSSVRPGLDRQLPTLDTRWNSATFYKHLARLHPTLITVIVRDTQGEKSTGSYPSRNFRGPTADVIFLTEAGTLSALAHEIGHFFGLLHTHGVWDRQPGSIQPWQMNLNGVNEADWSNLRRFVGEEYDSDLSDIYLPYDAEEGTLLAFENAQIFSRKALGWAEFTYTENFETVPSDAAFIELIRARMPPLMKNFVRVNEQGTFTGNNCGKSYVGEDRRTLRCKYGDGDGNPEHVLTAEHPLLGQSLLFGDSTESNLMSYISTYIDDGIRRKVHLTNRQRQLVRFGAAMPSRQRLRNLALED